MTRKTESIRGVRIDVVDWQTCLARVLGWAEARTPSYVCVCNTHSVVSAGEDADFRAAVEQCDMAVPDGMPLAWVLRLRGHDGQERINGPDLMLRSLAECEQRGLSVYFLGGTQETLAKLTTWAGREFPKLDVAGTLSPPFRPLSADEHVELLATVNRSEPHLVFVAFGCPRQEKWMAENTAAVRAPMLGVGAAFDYHAGVVKRPPLWMQRAGLEWFGRLVAEPRRLWRRYFHTNPVMFVYLLHQFGARYLSGRRRRADS